MTTRFLSVGLLIGLALAFGGNSIAAKDLPTVPSIQDRLVAEIQRMIAAGHLAPAVCLFEQHYPGDHERHGWEFDDYFHNPADTIYTLALAIPHLPQSVQPEAKTYLQAEFDLFPPYTYVHSGPSGARRESNPLPEEYRQDWTTYYRVKSAPCAQADNWAGWTFNPFNIYACFQYAKIFPDKAAELLNQLRDKVGDFPRDTAFLDAHPHVLNVYIAGYHGFLGLQDMISEQHRTDVETWLSAAQTERLRVLQLDPKNLPGAQAGGFLWLVPELGDYLYAQAQQRVSQVVTFQQWANPYWFVAKAQEVTRVDAVRSFLEGYHSHIYEVMSGFKARAYALKWSGTELQKVLDARAFARGDLYYIQNLVAVLEAGGIPDQVSTPQIIPHGGHFQSPQQVTLSCDTADTLIYYTLDQSEPSEASSAYANPINISTNATLKARAYKTGLNPSSVAIADFIFQDDADQEPDAGVESDAGSESDSSITPDAGLEPQAEGQESREEEIASDDTLSGDNSGDIVGGSCSCRNSSVSCSTALLLLLALLSQRRAGRRRRLGDPQRREK